MTDDAALVSPSVLQSLREIKQSIWYRIGTLHDDMNDPEAALSAFEKVLIQNPSNAAALAKIGILLMKKECYRDAISYLHPAVSINPENSPAWVALAYSYVMSEELDNAYQAYHTALSKITHHNDPTLWYGVGIMYDRMGLLDHALDAFHAVLNISPHFEAADKLYYDIGLIYKEQHKFELAHKYMSRVVSTKVQQPVAYAEALYQIGHIHELAGNIPSAMESYHSAVTRHPNHVKSLQSLAWLTYKSGNVEEASRLLGHAAQVEPNDANTFYLIGRMAMATNDYHKAYDNYQHAVYRDGKNASFWCAIGILYFHMRQHRDAMDAYSRAIRINPQMPEVWYDMGTLYEAYNQMTDATDAYHRVLQLQPNDPQATQRLQILRQAANGCGVISSTPSPLPRTAGPVVSPASAARAHTRSEAPERIGALPAPPRGPARNNLSASAPAPYPMSTPTSQIQTTKPVSTITSVPTTAAQMDPKLGPPRSSPITSAANGIVADSNAYPPVSQGKQYANVGHGNMSGNGPTGYSTGHDRRNSGPMPPVTAAPEASSQLSSLNNQQQHGGHFNQSRAPPEPISSRPMGRMAQGEKISLGISSQQQVIHPSQPLNTMPMLTSPTNGSPRRGVPGRGPGVAHGSAAKPGEKQDHWNGNDARRNGYGESVSGPDSNPSGHIPREVRADPQYAPRGPSQSHLGSMNGHQRSEYHNEQPNPSRGETLPSPGDKSPGLRPPHNHQRPTGPVPPNLNSMPSDDRSRLSASSSYERKATPAEALRPSTSKEVTRTSGDGSIRSGDENRYGSPASRNSRRSLPAPLLGPPTGFNGRPQGMNMPSMSRGDDHLDEAMLPRLRPLPDNKPNSPRKDRDSKTSVAGNQGGPLAPVRHIDNGMQPGSHRAWNDSHSPSAQRGNLHGTPQQTNGGSPRSQRSPSGGRVPRDQTGPLRPGEPMPSRDPRYGNIQQTDTQQSGRNSAGLNPGNDSSRFQEEGDGSRMKQYSAHESMSPRGSNVEHPSSGEALKGSGQAPQQPTVMTSETYGAAGSFPQTRNGQAESEREQYMQPVQDPNGPNMGASNGYHRGATPAGVGEGGNSSAVGREMRRAAKASPTDSHFGSGTPPSFSKSLPRVSAPNGLMSAPLGRKETESSADQNRSYFDRTQGSYGGSERRSSDVSNGYDVSPRGSKRKIDLVDDRTERSGDKQYPREQGEAGGSDGKPGISAMGRSDAPLYSQMSARSLPEPISTQRGDGEDGGHPQKRLRAHGIGEEGLPPLVNGGQLKSRE